MAGWPVALFALLILLPAPARAEPALARDDLALSRLLARQEARVAEALQAVEDRAAGRADAEESRRRVGRALEQVRSLEQQVRARKAQALLAGPARALAADRLRQAKEALDLVSQPTLTPDALAAFARSQGRRAQESLAAWLRARLDGARRLVGAPAVGPYYAWQSRLLPLQLEEVALAGEVQAALQGGKAAGLAARGRRLAEGVAALKVAPGLARAQAAAAREAESLARLAEAADLLARDPSPDSASRVQRWSRSLRKDSAAAGEESLEALASALAEG